MHSYSVLFTLLSLVSSAPTTPPPNGNCFIEPTYNSNQKTFPLYTQIKNTDQLLFKDNLALVHDKCSDTFRLQKTPDEKAAAFVLENGKLKFGQYVVNGAVYQGLGGSATLKSPGKIDEYSSIQEYSFQLGADGVSLQPFNKENWPISFAINRESSVVDIGLLPGTGRGSESRNVETVLKTTKRRQDAPDSLYDRKFSPYGTSFIPSAQYSYKRLYFLTKNANARLFSTYSGQKESFTLTKGGNLVNSQGKYAAVFRDSSIYFTDSPASTAVVCKPTNFGGLGLNCKVAVAATDSTVYFNIPTDGSSDFEISFDKGLGGATYVSKIAVQL